MNHLLPDTLEELIFVECRSRSVLKALSLAVCPAQAMVDKEEGRELVINPFA